MGKYDHVLGGLTRELKGEGSFREKVTELKRELPKMGSTQLAEAYETARKMKADLEEKLSALNAKIAAVEELLWDAFDEEGVSSLKLKSGASVRVQPEPVAAVVDKEALRNWAIENGLERLLALSWQTTNSLMKERMLNQEPLPAGVEAKVRTKTVFSKGK